MKTNSLWEEKWRVFEKRAKLFRYIPFAEFVLLAGSMATGRVHEKSDFDVILGVRSGRVFTAWFLSALAFQAFGWREKPGADTTNRFGLSHFAAPEGYRLSPPYNAYWKSLYAKLIPVMGDEKKIARFFAANDWFEPVRAYERHERYISGVNSACKSFLEFILGGRLGNLMERTLKKWLVRKIKNPEKLGYKPRVVWGKEKLELYRDTRRIENMLREGSL